MAIAAVGTAGVGVRIAEVRVQDFRVIRDGWLPLEAGTTVLVGENNAGKSSFFQAMEAALGRRTSTEDDLHTASGGERADHFQVDLLIVPAAGPSFDEDVTGAYASAIQPPGGVGREFVAVRTFGRTNPDGGPLRIEHMYLQGWGRSREAAAAVPALNQPRYMSPAADLIHFFLLDAARDLVSELRTRSSAWGRSVAELGLAPGDRVELNAKLADLGAEIAQRSPVLQSLRSALDRVRDLIASGVASTSIAAIPRDVAELPRSMDILVQAPASASLPLRLQGMGGRSLASLMIFQAFVDVRLAKQVIPPLAVSAFEEPEAHLHPHAQRAVAQQIDSIGGQKLISTHSPYVAAAGDLAAIRVLTRQGASVQVRRLEAAMIPDEQTLAKRLLQRRGGETLFARVAILVEGESEEAAVAVFGDAHWGGRLSSLGVSVLAVDGAQGFEPIVFLLEQLGIQWVLLVDGDADGDNGLARVSGRLGRAVDRTTAGVFQLPAAHAFEEYLSSCGLTEEIEAAIASRFGGGVLAQYKAGHEGTPYRGGQGNRDYSSAGGADRLVRDFLRSKKGQYGRAVAEGICSTRQPDGQPKMPSIVRDLLKYADSILQ